MISAALYLLILLQIKHWYIDFVNQSMDEVNNKGTYWHWTGMKHSVKQGIGTFVCVWAIVGYAYIPFAIIVGLIDFVLHYNIDWAKMNWGNRDITTPQFWNHLGLDQMAHQLTYIMITYMVIA
jgi:hypothetical protein